jgi:hypothetical protein
MSRFPGWIANFLDSASPKAAEAFVARAQWQSGERTRERARGSGSRLRLSRIPVASAPDALPAAKSIRSRAG